MIKQPSFISLHCLFLTVGLLLSFLFPMSIFQAHSSPQGENSLTHSSTHLKIGIIDMNRIFSSYKKTQRAQQEYLANEATVKKEFEKRASNLKKEIEKVNQLTDQLNKGDLSSSEKKAKQKELEDATAQARIDDQSTADYRSSESKKLEDQFLKVRQDIIADIMRVITDQTKTLGYDLVLDKSSPSAIAVPMVLYSKPEYEITDKIISLLNDEDDSNQSKENKKKNAPPTKLSLQ